MASRNALLFLVTGVVPLVSACGAGASAEGNGVNPPATTMLRIGDFAWDDRNENGIQDEGEPGLAGVLVELFKAGVEEPVDGITTVEGGAFEVVAVEPGAYTIEVTAPAGYIASPCGEGGDGTRDSDCLPIDHVVEEGALIDDLNVDFGFYQSECAGGAGRIGDFVWLDENGDGIQQTGSEHGLVGVEVLLLDELGGELERVSTGRNGYYEFNELIEGVYRVEVDLETLQPGLAPTLCEQGTDRAADSDCTPSVVELDACGDDPTVDFGFVPATGCSGTIGDRVWCDLDQDGRQDAGELGLDGVRVLLEDALGNLFAETVTVRGRFEFGGLCAGAYVVRVDESSLGPDFVSSPCLTAVPEDLDSNCQPAPVVLSGDDAHDDTVDFGYYGPGAGAIGDRVWYDRDGDGLQHADRSLEPGLEGVPVRLEDELGELLASQETGPDGFYRFECLPAGAYRVVVDEEARILGELIPTPTDVGPDDAIDSDPNPATVELVMDDTRDSTIDFGFRDPEDPGCEGTGAIGDYVWRDDDRDGLQDRREPGLAMVKVVLRDALGVELASRRTDVDGFYEFTGLCAGTYRIEVDRSASPALDDLVPSPTDVGPDDSVDSDPSPVFVELLTDGSRDETIDFGFHPRPAGAGEGCTPGYWKVPQHFDSWPAPYTPDTPFADVFEDAFPGLTLIDVLHRGGGNLNALGRHTVGALLNAASAGVSFGLTADEVRGLFDETFPGSDEDYEDLKALFEDLNEGHCPLN